MLATHHFLSPEDFKDISDLVEKSYLPSVPLVLAVDMPQGFMGTTEDNVDALFVHAENRRQGVGRLPLGSFLAGREEVTVDVNEQNASGRAFYGRMGFEVMGRSDVDDAGGLTRRCICDGGGHDGSRAA